MEEKRIACKDCGIEFILTPGEQEFYKNNNLIEPKRCKSCRIKRKETFNNGSKK